MQLPGILKTHQPTPNRMSSADAEPGGAAPKGNVSKSTEMLCRNAPGGGAPKSVVPKCTQMLCRDPL